MTHIDINRDWDVRFWCKQFKCTKTVLRDTVKRVGVLAKDVARALDEPYDEQLHRPNSQRSFEAH